MILLLFLITKLNYILERSILAHLKIFTQEYVSNRNFLFFVTGQLHKIFYKRKKITCSLKLET